MKSGQIEREEDRNKDVQERERVKRTMRLIDREKEIEIEREKKEIIYKI